jgi:hypothetical protein
MSLFEWNTSKAKHTFEFMITEKMEGNSFPKQNRVGQMKAIITNRMINKQKAAFTQMRFFY